MIERFNNNMYMFGVVTVEFFLSLTFPDVMFLQNLLAVTCGIFLFDSLRYLISKKV